MKNNGNKTFIKNSKEYTLIKDDKSHKILIEQNDYKIIITSRQYQLIIDNLDEFYKSNLYEFKSFYDLIMQFLIPIINMTKSLLLYSS